MRWQTAEYWTRSRRGEGGRRRRRRCGPSRWDRRRGQASRVLGAPTDWPRRLRVCGRRVRLRIQYASCLPTFAALPLASPGPKRPRPVALLSFVMQYFSLLLPCSQVATMMTLINERVYEFFPTMHEAFKAFGMGRSPSHRWSLHTTSFICCGSTFLWMCRMRFLW